MYRSSVPSAKDTVRFAMRALAKQEKIPPVTRFRRLVRMGLIDNHGNLDLSHVSRTTLGELARKMRSKHKVNGNAGPRRWKA